ncbi:hypothetical protein DL93DRAFT_2176819 [Clavulina sp. PMI_390]|nr:hypothetical protein DL93DRAFT_2176819 [Clavulina sp. PMI_390]
MPGPISKDTSPTYPQSPTPSQPNGELWEGSPTQSSGTSTQYKIDQLLAYTKGLCEDVTAQASYLQPRLEAELSGLSPSRWTRTELRDQIPSLESLEPVFQRLEEVKSTIQQIEGLKLILAARKHNLEARIFRLPTEIILQIFELGVPCPDNPWRDEISPRRASSAPVWRECTAKEYGIITYSPVNAPNMEQIILGLLDAREDETPDLVSSSIFHPLQPHLPSIKRVRFDPYMFPAKAIEDFLVEHPHTEQVVLDNYAIQSLNDDPLPLTTALEALRNTGSSDDDSETRQPASLLKELRINFLGLGDATESFLGAVTKELIELHQALPDLEVFAYCDTREPLVGLPFLRILLRGEPDVDDFWPSPWAVVE